MTDEQLELLALCIAGAAFAGMVLFRRGLTPGKAVASFLAAMVLYIPVFFIYYSVSPVFSFLEDSWQFFKEYRVVIILTIHLITLWLLLLLAFRIVRKPLHPAYAFFTTLCLSSLVVWFIIWSFSTLDRDKEKEIEAYSRQQQSL